MKKLMISGVLVLFSINTQAVLLAYEGFDYSGVDLNRQGGGTGWGDVWYDGGFDFSHLTDDNVSLESSAFPYTPVGSRIEGVGGAAERNVVNKLSMNVDGVRYFSVMMSKSSTAATGGESVLIWMKLNAVERVKFGMSSDNKFYARAGDDFATSAGTVEAGVTYFLVAKIVTSAAGDDTLYLKAYAPTDTVDSSEPTDWTVVNATSDGTIGLDRLKMVIGGSIAAPGGAIDEIRIGQTWEDVAYVPDLATMGLFAQCGGLRLSSGLSL